MIAIETTAGPGADPPLSIPSLEAATTLRQRMELLGAEIEQLSIPIPQTLTKIMAGVGRSNAGRVMEKFKPGSRILRERKVVRVATRGCEGHGIESKEEDYAKSQRD